MNAWIGSAGGSLLPALKNCFAKKNCILMQQGNYFLITIDEPCTALAVELTQILLENLLPQLLVSAVVRHAPELNPEETKQILTRTVTALKKSGFLFELYAKISEQILILFKESNLLTLEGILFFRCRDLFSSMDETLRKILFVFRADRTLSSLREYVRRRASRVDYLRVRESSHKFYLFDANNRRIRIAFPENYTPEEALLNALLYFAPAVLDIHQLQNPELRTLLSEIFSEQILP